MTDLNPPLADRPLLRIGAILAVAGVLLTLGYAVGHPAREDPTDHPRVFLEYAQSDAWVAIHLIQFAGFASVFGALIALTPPLSRKSATVAALARLGVAGAVAGIAVAAVLQAVDGIALKAAVDAWAGSPTSRRPATFAVAEGVRWLEIAINAHFRLIQGSTVFLFGAALAIDDRFPRWLGWVGAVAGAGMLARGLAVASTGFALSNPVYVASEIFRVLLYLWLLALATAMWRRGRGSSEPSRGAGM